MSVTSSIKGHFTAIAGALALSTLAVGAAVGPVQAAPIQAPVNA